MGARIEEVTDAAKRNPWSRDIAFLERRLAQHWNKLVAELTAANVQHEYKAKTIVVEEKTVPLTWLQQMFVINGMGVRDLTKDDSPPRSAFGDGMKDLIGY